MPSKQSERRQVAKLKHELYSGPWAIDARALGVLAHAVETGDLAAIEAALSLGRDVESEMKIENGIAIIPITGVLRDEVDFMVRWGYASSYQAIERDFEQAIDNAQVKGVLFYINSPGGSAIGCKRLADLIFESRGDKPIRSFVQGVCGSAAFYVAAATDRIESTADSLVGSVGTIFPHQEFSGYLKEFGIGAEVFTNTDSPKKGHGNMYEPLSEAARQTLQDYVNSYGQAFINDVARYRNVKPEDVIAKYGQGDAMRADIAIKSGVIDAVVGTFEETFTAISGASGANSGVTVTEKPGETGNTQTRRNVMNERIKAQLFAMGLIDSLEASDEVCKAALASWFKSRSQAVPSDEAVILKSLQEVRAEDGDGDEEEDDENAEGNDGDKEADDKSQRNANAEQAEARLADLRAAADLHNQVAGYTAVTADMVLAAHDKGLNAKEAGKEWAKAMAEKEPPIPGARITGEGADRYANDVIEALVYRATNDSSLQLSDNAAPHVRKPLWAIAGECLQLAGGRQVDMYGDRESLASEAMQMGAPGARHAFFSENEGRQYIQASGVPAARPGDYPNILSGLANRFLDTVQLDDDYSYPMVSAVLPGGLSDFKPATMINKGIVEELDELEDAEAFKQLGVQEEVLSYIFLRRFGNKWGWTPVMIANDDLGAFVEGMIGLQEAWQVTQNRLVVDRYTSNETLLDGSALFANRADTGVGSNPAANNNDRSSGAAPSDSEWGALETLYADIGGIATGRRVRGTLTTCFCPTGSVAQEARRTFLPLNAGGLEMKVANTTANVGLYRGEVNIVPESELRVNSAAVWYGLRNPTRLNTATVVRGYFNGFGTAGRRERWYDPENKTTWVSIEGRIAVAVKNWRYAVRNAGA